MLYNPSTSDSLRSWLIKTLEPICDAEPGALADYVIALLAHDAPETELRKEFIGQLEEFLEKGAADFVDTLFSALRSKSYLPYSSPSGAFTSMPLHSQDHGIPIPLDALLGPSSMGSPDRGTKRHLELDEHDSRGPPKGPRLSHEGHFSRYPQPNGHHIDAGNWNRGGGMNGRGGPPMSMGMGMNGPMNGAMNGHMGMGQGQGRGNFQHRGPDMPLPRGVCRDYHLKGYCGRGAMCKYSHDDAAVAPAQIPFQGAMGGSMTMPVGPGPFMPVFNPFQMGGNGQGAAYDPHEAHMDMRPGPSHGVRPPPPRVPLLPRAQDANGVDQHMRDVSGELPVIQDLTPRVTPDGLLATDPSRNTSLGNNDVGNQMDVQNPMMMGDGYGGPMLGRAPDGVANSPGMGAVTAGTRPTVGGNPAFRGGMRGRGRGGTFGVDRQTFHSDHMRDNRTLVVEKIPEEHLTLEAVNGWFKRFGTVTNVAIDRSGAKALVSFSSHDEAQSAWRAQDAVFNNRFVKIFWHRPMEGQGSVGQRMLQASAPLVANMSTVPAPEIVPPKPAVTPALPSKGAPSAAVSALAAKQQILEKQIAEQKELMARLSTVTAEGKKEIMARLRKLGDEMKSPSSGNVPIAPTHTRKASAQLKPGPEEKERKAKELLDMELDIHAQTTSHDTGAANGKEGEGESETQSLEEKLARLRAEADALGISDLGHSHQPSYRPYRGRGRGRGAFRGAARGGPPRASMKLDNRPRVLLVKVPNAQDAEIVQAVRGWYELGGQMDNLTVGEDEGIVVQFKSRGAAEQALAKGSNIPSVGSVKLSWHTAPTVIKPGPAVSVSTQSADGQKRRTDTLDDRPASPHHDDIPGETGWGDGEEDGMGMF